MESIIKDCMLVKYIYLDKTIFHNFITQPEKSELLFTIS